MRYRLRTLMFWLALVPPVIDGAAYLYRLDEDLLWGPLALGFGPTFTDNAIALVLAVALIAGMANPLITRSVAGALVAIASAAIWLYLGYWLLWTASC